MGQKEFYAAMRANIEKHGRTVLSVFPTKDEPDDPPFAYSIGNHLAGMPELLVIGLDGQDAQPLINLWSKMMIERARAFDDRELVEIGGKYPTMAIHAKASVKDNFTIQAGQFLGHQDYRVIQMLFTDPNGIFPTQPGCDPLYKKLQPFMGELNA